MHGILARFGACRPTPQEEALPDVIPIEMCYLGWQESLSMLGALVEPEIP